jgi:hypothetical protein
LVPVKAVPSLQVAVTVPVLSAPAAVFAEAEFAAGAIAGLTALFDSVAVPHDCTPPRL